MPLAAALWKGGISFGGVIAFIFADLITFPLLLIYRRYYGTRAHAADAGVVLGPHVDRRPGHREHLPGRGPGADDAARSIAPAHFSWNYTTYLNIVFLVVFGVLYWLYRNRERLGGGERYARGPRVRDAGGDRPRARLARAGR